MVSKKDTAAILRGFSLIMEQLVSRQQTHVARNLTQIQYHATELISAMMKMQQIRNETTQGSPMRNDPHEEKKKEKYDPTGFGSLSDIDMSATVTGNSKSKFMKEREVPATPFARLIGFGGLAVRMVTRQAVERTSTLVSGTNNRQIISDENAEILSETLCRMRGASLKLGQMLSVQDTDVLPPALMKALERVKQSADYMPRRQLESQLINQLGENWRSNFAEFDDIPIAAASIGQVHKGTLVDGTVVAVKIQYPGVAESIDSDLGNLKRLLSIANVLPRGLFVDEIIRVASTELAEECNYDQEARSQQRYRDFVVADPVVSQFANVPAVFPALSSNQVLTSEFVQGFPIDKAAELPQPVRNAIARAMLIMTFKELFEWRLVQSDPNFANFLYDHSQRRINLIDFGAAREYSKSFVDGYMHLVWAAANKDRDTIISVSKQLGFLTGDESAEMLAAHVGAGLVVGEPFLTDSEFDFAGSQLSARISEHGSTFATQRLTPPPVEAYSLHRKLAGAFALCIRLKACIKCRDILEDTYRSYNFHEAAPPAQP